MPPSGRYGQRRARRFARAVFFRCGVDRGVRICRRPGVTDSGARVASLALFSSGAGLIVVCGSAAVRALHSARVASLALSSSGAGLIVVCGSAAARALRSAARASRRSRCFLPVRG